MTVLLLLTGGMGTSDKNHLVWPLVVCFWFTFVYDLTIGPMCYCIVGEMPSSNLEPRR